MLPMVRLILSEYFFSPIPHNSATADIVTADVPRDHHHTGMNSRQVIKVQPLKKDEMQPSYAQDMGSETVTHGFYGSMMQSLGACIGFCGAIPCCPLPNPFKEVRQGGFSLMFPNLHHSIIYSLFSNMAPWLQAPWDLSHASVSSTRQSIRDWPRSMSAPSRFAS
jgi:hypothetical protein